ncbi:NAD(P)H-dependent glycerol-3-phosphate dehydrogenase [Thermovenabulum gondwanense]|uniref:Glycerol-3-phosphate dehydrogenase [NAD(P)+] n=1 Tax=Thermovenabulum gondwanense TaxID=520767 RepID=A0A161PV14_9FIRM|nr:NAD(P)H-dependent glycerol-3-phosphate dehydrogenase [Thermovenabulum gondwanense]KYO66706.1 Glycerol-3-phosphate dehydrogenase [NAD(P)+] [Thermovenabulum gondwanense]
MRISILGAGSWGTALSNVVSDNKHEVILWARRRELAEEINQIKENREYLPGAKINSSIVVTHDLEYAVKNSEIVILATPSQALRSILREAKKYIKNDTIILNASKGIENESLMRMSEVIKEEIPQNSQIAVISGPSHAEEVIRRYPTAVVVASKDKRVLKVLQEVFINNYFRVYRNYDVIGVELGGALKNIIAICSGVSEGLGYGDNTRAALITRGIIEIMRLGKKLGAKNSTFSGLSGIGDVIVTCSSMHSRNRRAGIEIGKGKKVDEIVKSTKMVIEGIYATKAAKKLSDLYDVEMPITQEAYKVLFEDKDPKKAVDDLMARRGKIEVY